MIVYVKKGGDSIPVDCKDQEAVDVLVRIHGEDAVIRPEGAAPVVEAVDDPVPEEPMAGLPTEATTDEPAPEPPVDEPEAL